MAGLINRQLQQTTPTIVQRTHPQPCRTGFSFQASRGCPIRLTGLPRHDREASLQWVIRATAMDE